MAKQLFTFTKERPNYRTIWEKLPDTYEYKIGLQSDFETKCILYSRLMLNDWGSEVSNLNNFLNGKPFKGTTPSELVLMHYAPENLDYTYNPDNIPFELLLFAKEQSPETGMFEKLVPDASPIMAAHQSLYDHRDSNMLTYYNLNYVLQPKELIDMLLKKGRVIIDNRLETININSRQDMINTIINRLASMCIEINDGALPVQDVNLMLGEFKLWNT